MSKPPKSTREDQADADKVLFGRSLFDDPSARALSRVGVVDVGSNSVRMVVFDGAARSPAYFYNEKIMCGLGKGLAETNRHPFDVVEGESEIVAGHMVEYSGMSYAMFYLAEYANMWLIALLTVVMFFGGWQAPIDSMLFNWMPPTGWLLIKVFFVVSMFLWFRATFPRYRYDQIMRLGWKVLIPVTLVWIAVEGLMVYWGVGPWKN